ncbi:MAG: outer membrane protein transport protein [Myxococcales bacterium]
MRSLKSILAALSVGAFTLTGPLQKVQASGFAAPSVGPSSTGVTTTTDPSVLAQNPAGIGFVKGTRVIGGGNILIGKLSYQRERFATYQYSDSLDFALPIDPSLVDPKKRGKEREVSDRPVGLVPSIFGSTQLGDLPLVVGLGIYVPYAAMLHLPKNGPQRFQLTDAFIAAGQFTPTIAYQPIEELSIGLGVSYVMGYADLAKTQDLATLSDLGDALARPPIGQSNSFGPNADPGVRELDTMARPFHFKNGVANGFTFSAGITAQPLKDLWLAASYEHTTKMTFRGDFTLDMDDPFFTQDLQSQGLKYPALVKGKASLAFTLPRTVRYGIRYGFGEQMGDERQVNVSLEGSYTGWSSVDNFDVRIKSPSLAQPMLGLPSSTGLKLARAWRDTYGVRTRLRYLVSEELAVWGMLGIETGASPDSTIDMASPDGTRVHAALGLSQRLTDNVRILLDGQLQTILERRVASSDYDLGNGTYNLRILALGGYLDFAF